LLIALSLFCLYIMCMLFSIIHIFIIVDWFVRLFLLFVLN
jgi:hypothetical protein